MRGRRVPSRVVSPDDIASAILLPTQKSRAPLPEAVPGAQQDILVTTKYYHEHSIFFLLWPRLFPRYRCFAGFTCRTNTVITMMTVIRPLIQ